MGAPPGGPERLDPPVLVRVTPDSGATNVRERSVTFEFDVVVSDRDVSRYFLISPRDGAPRVRWRRDRVEIRPRRPFRENTAYTVTMLPGIADLRGNPMKTGKSVVFSTGPTIPSYVVAGRVFDWMNDRVAPNALVEVIRRPDSLPYVGAADSTGKFAVGPLDEGTYTVRAIMDNNKNLALDRGEGWDSVSIAVRGASPFIELLAAPRDTLPPRLMTVTPRDSVTFIANFDQPLSAPPEPTLNSSSFRVVGRDSVPLRVVAVRSRVQADSIRAVRDSIARSDSTARDTTTRRDSTRVTPPPAPTVAMPPEQSLKPSRPAPMREVIVELDPQTPMRPGTQYRVTVIDARGITGRTRTSDRLITMQAPRPQPARPPDGARPPAARP
jgi:hypothetical protein